MRERIPSVAQRTKSAIEGSEREQSKKQSVTDASSEDSRREKIEKIDEEKKGNDPKKGERERR